MFLQEETTFITQETFTLILGAAIGFLASIGANYLGHLFQRIRDRETWERERDEKIRSEQLSILERRIDEMELHATNLLQITEEMRGYSIMIVAMPNLIQEKLPTFIEDRLLSIPEINTILAVAVAVDDEELIKCASDISKSAHELAQHFEYIIRSSISKAPLNAADILGKIQGNTDTVIANHGNLLRRTDALKRELIGTDSIKTS